MIHVAFIKNNIVMDILLFSEENDNTELIASIITNKGYDSSVQCSAETPNHSTWNGVEFTETSLQILHELGVRDYVEPIETIETTD